MLLLPLLFSYEKTNTDPPYSNFLLHEWLAKLLFPLINLCKSLVNQTLVKLPSSLCFELWPILIRSQQEDRLVLHNNILWSTLLSFILSILPNSQFFSSFLYPPYIKQSLLSRALAKLADPRVSVYSPYSNNPPPIAVIPSPLLQ
jgi:hypothetical protein